MVLSRSAGGALGRATVAGARQWWLVPEVLVPEVLVRGVLVPRSRGGVVAVQSWLPESGVVASVPCAEAMPNPIAPAAPRAPVAPSATTVRRAVRVRRS